MKKIFGKTRSGFSAQLIMMMTLLNLGITFLSFALGYILYELAFNYELLSPQALADEFILTPVDLVWAILVITLGFIFSTFLAIRYAKNYVQPIDAMAVVAQHIQQGNLTSRITESLDQTPQELKTLIQNFNAMADQLECSVKNASFWNAAIAHELRTPITILQGRLQGIVDGVFKPDQTLHLSLLNQVEGLSYLVEDLRTLSLIEHQQLRLDLQQHAIQPSILKCIEIFQSRFDHKGLELKLELQDAKIRCDLRRFEQVLIALFSNALRYSDPGQLLLKTQSTQDEWILSLEDEGPGIEPIHAEQIFKPFYRLEDSRSRRDGSTGLGLAVVSAIIEAHQGKISYHSSATLGGSCFKISLKR